MRLSRIGPNPGSSAGAAAMPSWGDADPPVRIAGGIGLRIGNTRDLELYYGHVGYNVFPPARGNHYAERACRLLLPLARAHGLRRLWITCNPDNLASRRTCERLGCTMVDLVHVPAGHPLHLRGEREKCRYRLDL
jgi:tagatose 1,6-diphosphate aldolase